MDLQVLVSKKGTQVVTATNLHAALQLPAHKYNSNIKTWLKDVYAFGDDIRQAIPLQDFADRTQNSSKLKDYYLSVEFARLISLNSESKVKAKYARFLHKVEKGEEQNDILNKSQVLAVVELTKVMGLISCQKSVERLHHQFYEGRKGTEEQWWAYRAGLLGYSVETLKSKMMEIGKQYKGKNLIQMLMQVDKYEVIRMAVIDLFITLGRSRKYATTMGDLAKAFAKEMQIPIWDDRKSSIDFAANNVNKELVNEVISMQQHQQPGPLVRQLFMADVA